MGGFCPGGFCPGGFYPGGFVRGVCPGDFVLEPFDTVTHTNRNFLQLDNPILSYTPLTKVLARFVISHIK